MSFFLRVVIICDGIVMSIHHLPVRISTIKSKLHDFSGWELEAVKGYIQLRDGTDYVNNNRRYDHALEHLNRAYDQLLLETPKDVVSLSRLCLWKGIALNENEDLDKVQRNKDAITEYKKGLEWIEHKIGGETQPIRMSLHNSYGVAIHHLNIGRGDHRIPKEAFYHYRAAKALFHRNPDHPFMRRIMKKVETNTGYIIQRGGASGMVSCNDAC
jgi:hypothetical protein